MTVQELLDNGYKEFRPNSIITSANKSFQKRVSDDIGKKYFITVNYFEPYEDKPYPSFEVDLQFEKKIDNITVVHNILLFGFAVYDEEKQINDYSLMSIKTIEEHIESVWNSLNFEYHEKY